MKEQHKLFLFFRDKKLEKEYRLNYDDEMRLPLRFGIIISIVSWVSALYLVYTIVPDKASWLGPLTLAVICPLFIFITWATFWPSWRGRYHTLGAISNLWAGLYVVYFCSQFPKGGYIILPTLIFIIFFGSYMVRLRWLTGFFAALIYIATYQVYLLKYSDLASDQILLHSFVSWLTLSFSFFAGRISESNNRIRFIQNKTISSQADEIKKEKEAADKLLLNILPPFIADELKSGDQILGTHHRDCSVLFADLEGFTELCTSLDAVDLVRVLNDIFSEFDQLAEKYELEKIKTMGDGYMIVGGLTKSRSNHLVDITNFAIEIRNLINNGPEYQKYGLKLRVGIHTGPVVAGVIGLTKFQYDLWGETVNLASRLESEGESDKIQVSESVYSRLRDKFELTERGQVELKGFGKVLTYYLNNTKVVNKPQISTGMIDVSREQD
ncbi:MAG: adenylate cyclase [Crocinitomicaceae bacterium]